MSIRIGDKNKIKNSYIGDHYSLNGGDKDFRKKKKFHAGHPVLFSLLTSILGGIILLFSFWENLIKWIENLFK